MAFAWKRANPLRSLKLLMSHRQLIGLATIDFIVNVAHQVLPSIVVLFAAHRGGWSETTVGLTLAFVGVSTGVVSGFVVGPSILDLMSRRVSESEEGQLQGANSSSRSISGLIGPAIFTTTFAWLLGWLPGVPFLLAALLLALAAGVTWIVTRPSEGQAPLALSRRRRADTGDHADASAPRFPPATATRRRPGWRGSSFRG